MENKRILALDILRGITIAGMILVNTPGDWGHIYAPLCHASWNGLTPTDLIFPFFMFIMGISTYISLRKYHFEFSMQAFHKITKRTILIFLVGLALNWFFHFCFYWGSAPEGLGFGTHLWNACWTFDSIRILGVMQRLALCYFATAILALTVNHRRLPWLIFALLVIYSIVLLTGNGYEYNESNILSVVDRTILTPAHMYRDNGIDPEGILSTLPAIAHVLLGFCVGKMLLGNKQTAEQTRMELLHQHILRLFLVGTILTFVGFLLSYGLPMNKKIWSPSFVLVTCGMASSMLALLIWIIDIKGYKRWSLFFESFGVNPLFLYVLSGVLSILFDTIILPIFGGISIHTLLYEKLFCSFCSEINASLLFAVVFVVINWCIGYPLYKNKIYIKL